ncbi:STAS-like domain-containing protein [Gluconacetobacter diazotrophicus]|uniref:DUF4325 domain-containing protein n=1 Tax=Gluconacetobacter diazotrophicus (strain ATCC 49037 / DSM 5601 / CCUG 37298 / CIP 103539 / LMG 7603 / PAl5) TaxID=272568 RepID=A9H234_GLUDA|nr:STAS-like domain-containing protein [Gluconacetobacter diazotrophicus]CAP54094.1 hypothetical protein GDI0151 [Gluconacetobacter diazotrophicus PA1 5]
MGNEIMIKMANFSAYPSGREDEDGAFNGTRFRETILRPAIEAAKQNGQVVCVSLENVLSFGSSFLEEAFGGLVRKGIADKKFLKSHLIIDPGKPSYERYKDVIFQYINDAKVA